MFCLIDDAKNWKKALADVSFKNRFYNLSSPLRRSLQVLDENQEKICVWNLVRMGTVYLYDWDCGTIIIFFRKPPTYQGQWFCLSLQLRLIETCESVLIITLIHLIQQET